MGLSPQEAHLQAEQIFKHIESLSDGACRDYLYARYCYVERFDELMQRVFSRLLYSGGIHNRDVRKVVLEEPPGNLQINDPKVVAMRKRLFGEALFDAETII